MNPSLQPSSGSDAPPIKVLVVEDSQVIRDFLVYVLESDSGLKVIGTARNGEEAVSFVEREKPDVVTMDIHMPKMDGLEATRRIMETRPVPIVIVSGSGDPKEVATTFEAIEAGAVAVLARPNGIGHTEYEATAKELVRTVKLMAEVKVVRRWPQARKGAMAAASVREKKSGKRIQIVAIGVSTGGPVVLQTILSGLPKNLPVPLVIVQHMAAGFVSGFAEWLSRSAGFPVHVATHGERLQPGHAYLAPDHVHMSVGSQDQILLHEGEPENGMCPSVSFLFREVAKMYGPAAVGVILTGMGKDGAQELKLMKDSGAVTIVQDQDSSVVHGMPGEAKKLDAAMYVLSPDRIAVALGTLAENHVPFQL